MATKHTPGPWSFYAPNEGRNIVSVSAVGGRGYGGTVALFPPEPSFPNEQRTANAMLTAAAPDLLEALESAVRIIEGEWPGLWAEGREAIEKATVGR